MHLVRKLSLSPFENAILLEISEAGSEDVPVVMNALVHFRGVDASPENYILAFEQAIRRLCKLELIELVLSDRPGYPPVPSSEITQLLRFGTWISWETDGGYWRNALPGAENVAIACRRGASRST